MVLILSPYYKHLPSSHTGAIPVKSLHFTYKNPINTNNSNQKHNQENESESKYDEACVNQYLHPYLHSTSPFVQNSQVFSSAVTSSISSNTTNSNSNLSVNYPLKDALEEMDDHDEELYLTEDKRKVVWRGLDGSGPIYKVYSFNSPVLQAVWCTFDLDRLNRGSPSLSTKQKTMEMVDNGDKSTSDHQIKSDIDKISGSNNTNNVGKQLNNIEKKINPPSLCIVPCILLPFFL